MSGVTCREILKWLPQRRFLIQRCVIKMKLKSEGLGLLQKYSSSRKLLLFGHCSSCYCSKASGIVSVVQRVASQLRETSRELLYDPTFTLAVLFSL